MKKYTSLGEIIQAFRKYNNLSQSELASKLDVDIRSVIRWEKNETLVNSEKEKVLTEVTFIPYQVIRNLNSSRPIATFYDFDLDKYSLSGISSELPDARWIGAKIDNPTDRIRPIETEQDIDHILRFTHIQRNPLKSEDRDLIIQATKIMPELNLIIEDHSGEYAGHCVYFPLSLDFYKQIRERTIIEKDIQASDLVNWQSQNPPVFYCHSITADSNENFFYIIGEVLKFYRDVAPESYIYALLTSRYDSREMSEQFGVKTIWEDPELKEQYNMLGVPRLVEGDFKAFFKSLK